MMENQISTKVKDQTPTPMQLLVNAQQSGASIEQMQQLMELQERWEAREAKKAYLEAMSLFREKVPTISKTRRGHNSKYAGLAETIEQIKPMLSQCGLSHQWKTRQDGDNITVECSVTHKLGHSEETSLTAGPDKTGNKNSIQAIASTIAYLERYTLYAILGLASREMDDDAQGAANPEPLVDDDQLANIDALLTETGADVEKFCAYMKVNSLPEIKAKDYRAAITALEAKRRHVK
jgi:hypothetical protein